MDRKKIAANDKVVKVFIYIALFMLAISIIVPVAWVFMASVKENSEFYGNPWSLPKGLYFQNFVDAFEKASMGSYMINSVIVTLLEGMVKLLLVTVTLLPLASVISTTRPRLPVFLSISLSSSLTYSCM